MLDVRLLAPYSSVRGDPMKRLCFAFLPLVVVVGAAFIWGVTPAGATGDDKVAASPRLGISVSVHRSADTPGAYECSVVVTDLASGANIAAPTIIAKYGQVAEAVNSMPGGETLRALVTVDSTGTIAEYSVSLARADEVLAQHKGKVALSR